MSTAQQANFSDDDDHQGPYVIRIRGLPWTTTKEDIAQFFEGVHILDGENGIYLITLPSMPMRPLGEAYVQLASQDDLELAHTFDRKMLGSRYIEVFDAHIEDFRNIINKQQNIDEDCVLRLRGLPWNATELDIADFFRGLQINAESDVHIHCDRLGRASGEAYVRFRSSHDCQEAMKRNKEKLGHRYIEIFLSSDQELQRSIAQTSHSQRNNRMRNSNGNGGGNGGGPMRDKWNNSRRNAQRPYGNGNGNNQEFRFQNRGNGNPQNQFDGMGNFGGNNFNGNGFNGNDFNGRNRGQNSFNNNDFRGNFQSQQSNQPFRNGNYNNSNNQFNGNGFGNGNGCNDFSNDICLEDRPMNFNFEFCGGGGGGGGNFNRMGNNRNNRNNMCDDRNEHGMLVRGMPFYCDEKDLYDFFAPIRPLHCKVLLNDQGRHTGKAEVYFESRNDVMQAMEKDREKMGSRYIELFDGVNRPRF